MIEDDNKWFTLIQNASRKEVDYTSMSSMWN
jgi:hypothetical protein